MSDTAQKHRKQGRALSLSLSLTISTTAYMVRHCSSLFFSFSFPFFLSPVSFACPLRCLSDPRSHVNDCLSNTFYILFPRFTWQCFHMNRGSGTRWRPSPPPPPNTHQLIADISYLSSTFDISHFDSVQRACVNHINIRTFRVIFEFRPSFMSLSAHPPHAIDLDSPY